MTSDNRKFLQDIFNRVNKGVTIPMPQDFLDHCLDFIDLYDKIKVGPDKDKWNDYLVFKMFGALPEKMQISIIEEMQENLNEGDC